MTSVMTPLCIRCKHYDAVHYGFRCAAFPRRIPDRIIDSEEIHDHPIRGDHGIQFDPIIDWDQYDALLYALIKEYQDVFKDGPPLMGLPPDIGIKRMMIAIQKGELMVPRVPPGADI